MARMTEFDITEKKVCLIDGIPELYAIEIEQDRRSIELLFKYGRIAFLDQEDYS